MGILDVLTGKKGKRQHAIAQKAFEVLEDQFADNREVLDGFYEAAAEAISSSKKAGCDKMAKDGRNFFRDIGFKYGNESLFNDVAAGSMFFPMVGQVIFSLMIFELWLQREGKPEEIKKLVKKIESYCS